MKSLLELSLNEIEQAITEAGLPRFVADQVIQWVYKKQTIDFDAMNNIAKPNREKLASMFSIPVWQQFEIKSSTDNRAKKYVITLLDGEKIEAVLLREKDYNTLCISSQVGCALKCQFCFTGTLGLKRNLSSAEIIAQILIAGIDKEPVSNIVFMGMGEPLLNYDAVVSAIHLINDPKGFEIGKRRITISTCGILDGIERLSKEGIVLNIAFSVGHPDPLKRRQLMPVETKNPIIQVARALKAYQSQHNRKLTLEYTLLQGKNDLEGDIAELINLAKYLNSKINLIAFNPFPGTSFKPVATQNLNLIKERIVQSKVDVTIRFRKGSDIGAACGQLG